MNLTCLNSGVNGWGLYNMGRLISNFSLYSERTPSRIILVFLPTDATRNLSLLRGVHYVSTPLRNPKAINEILNYALIAYVRPGLTIKDSFQKIYLMNH